MRRTFLLGLSLLGALIVAAPAQAAFPANVFGGAVTCTTVPAGSGVVSGERWCGGGGTGPGSRQLTTVGSFDNTPIDVAAYFPAAPAGGTDGNFPVVAVFHPYGSQKYPPADPADPLGLVQRWVTRGYAVFTMTTRGFFGSCGPTAAAPYPAAVCANGYIHLLSNKFEVRDAQTMLGKLADDGAINSTQIGATGISYGGGLSQQLGALKNRIYNDAGTLVDWKSAGGKSMSVAATEPDWGWSDLAYGLQPNGSLLDYAALNPYHGPNNDRAIGTQKLRWNSALYAGGAAAGKYCTTACPAEFDITALKAYTDTGGPYTNSALNAVLDTFSKDHSAYGTDDSVAPAPSLIQNGWNDDLFPVSEAIRYYNKVRQDHPDTPVNLFAADFGHSPRSFAAPNSDVIAALFVNQFAWMDYYVKGVGSVPQDAVGGATTIASGCSDATSSATATVSAVTHAATWAGLARGQLSVTDNAAKTVAAANGPFANAFSDGSTVCTTASSANTVGAATYTLPAQSDAYTLLGSPTVKVDTTVANANDQLLARLYDVDPTANNERLLTRAILRPGQGSKTQVFQLQPQQWTVAAGHALKLELLTQDDGTNNQPGAMTPGAYARNASGQAAVSVSNLSLRVPTRTAPTGNITAPAAPVLPAGYQLARDLVTPTPTATASPTPTATSSYYGIPTATPTPYVITPVTTKKKPGLTAKVRPKRDRRRPFKFKVTGKLKRPSGVSKSAGCKGKIKITVRKGKKVLAKKTTKVKSSCKYVKKNIRLKAKKAGRKGKAKFTISFRGNAKLKVKTIKRSARYGRK